jgi:oxygen-independent coproporphyrinogen-3 oxidase
MLALYAHVPFCVRRCAYCDFASEERRPGDAGRARLYLDSVAREAATSAARHAAVSTAYVGGGTPTALSDGEFAELFGLLCGGFDLSRVGEWTVEANPGTVDEARLGALRALGADRLSLGIQSFDERTLAVLGRIHTPAQAEEAFGAARKAGFENVSVDVIFAVPGQALEGVLGDVSRAAGLGPEHVSLYGLTYEQGTPMTRMREAGEVEPVPEELEREMYLASVEALEGAGYVHYEISNFALPGRESRHNLAYWEGSDYVGLGPSAASFVAGERTRNAADLDAYAARLARGEDPADERERLPPERAARELLMLGLRTLAGVDRDRFESRTGFRLEDALGAEGRRLVEGGWLELEGGALRLSRRALPVADTVLAEIV